MPYLRDTVYILKVETYREHDAWVSMYGREHGKLEAVARGVRSWKAKQHGHLEPLTKVDVMIAKGASFDKLAVAHAVSAQTDLRGQLNAMAMLGSFSHLVDSLTRQGLADPALFNLLEEVFATWRQAVREASAERTRLMYAASVLKLLDCLGYAPSFEHADVSDEARKLLHVLPHVSLSFALSVTASPAVFNQVSAMVEAALERTPLAEKPHGPATIAAFLT